MSLSGLLGVPSLSDIARIIKLVMILIAVIAVVGTVWYIGHLRSDLATSQANNAKLTAAVISERSVIAQKNLEAKQIQVANGKMQMVINSQDKAITKLSTEFNMKKNGQERDFGYLAAMKPGLIQNIINNGTKNTFRCLELLTGAKPNKGERSDCTKN